MREPFFKTEHMAVGYRGRILIGGIDLQLEKGEILTLIGPNGAGKSTILKSIARQLKLLGGKVLLEGENTAEMNRNRLARRQAVVLTDRRHGELMTCGEVVAAGRYPYTGSFGRLTEEDRRKTELAMETAGVTDLKDRPFDSISDGQRQRILLAAALCQEPELILLDEPTSFLDIRYKLEFLQNLRKTVRTQGTSVILSLHELDLAQKISDRVVCVKGPVIDRVGTPEEVFRKEYIRSLYEMREGTYDPLFGCVELPAGTEKTEEADIFVIAGGGSGIPLYRSLQRRGLSFVTGILHENDIDYHAAGSLAAEIISAPAFMPVPEQTFQAALARMKSCRTVYCPLAQFGEFNAMNRALRDAASREGKLKLFG